ncbi:MAG: hypothetical protein QXO40_00175 [Candidatus Aenigmatarchaeota archaeon]
MLSKKEGLISLAMAFDLKGHIKIIPFLSYSIGFNLGKIKHKNITNFIIEIGNRLGIRFKKYANIRRGVVRLEVNNFRDTLMLLYLLKDFSLRKKEIEETIRKIKKLELYLKRKRKRFRRIIEEVEEEYENFKKEVLCLDVK